MGGLDGAIRTPSDHNRAMPNGLNASFHFFKICGNDHRAHKNPTNPCSQGVIGKVFMSSWTLACRNSRNSERGSKFGLVKNRHWSELGHFLAIL